MRLKQPRWRGPAGGPAERCAPDRAPRRTAHRPRYRPAGLGDRPAGGETGTGLQPGIGLAANGGGGGAGQEQGRGGGRLGSVKKKIKLNKTGKKNNQTAEIFVPMLEPPGEEQRRSHAGKRDAGISPALIKKK